MSNKSTSKQDSIGKISAQKETFIVSEFSPRGELPYKRDRDARRLA